MVGLMVAGRDARRGGTAAGRDRGVRARGDDQAPGGGRGAVHRGRVARAERLARRARARGRRRRLADRRRRRRDRQRSRPGSGLHWVSSSAVLDARRAYGSRSRRPPASAGRSRRCCTTSASSVFHARRVGRRASVAAVLTGAFGAVLLYRARAATTWSVRSGLALVALALGGPAGVAVVLHLGARAARRDRPVPARPRRAGRADRGRRSWSSRTGSWRCRCRARRSRARVYVLIGAALVPGTVEAAAVPPPRTRPTLRTGSALGARRRLPRPDRTADRRPRGRLRATSALGAVATRAARPSPRSRPDRARRGALRCTTSPPAASGFDEAATVTIAAQHGAALGTAIAHDGGNMLGYYALLHVLIGAFGNGALRAPAAVGARRTVATVALVVAARAAAVRPPGRASRRGCSRRSACRSSTGGRTPAATRRWSRCRRARSWRS